MGASGVFLAFVVVAGILGFTGLADGGADAFAKFAFFIFLVLLVGSLLFAT